MVSSDAGVALGILEARRVRLRALLLLATLGAVPTSAAASSLTGKVMTFAYLTGDINVLSEALSHVDVRLVAQPAETPDKEVVLEKTRTDSQGSFSLDTTVVQSGVYSLIINGRNFARVQTNVTITQGQSQDVGTIPLYPEMAVRSARCLADEGKLADPRPSRWKIRNPHGHSIRYEYRIENTAELGTTGVAIAGPKGKALLHVPPLPGDQVLVISVEGVDIGTTPSRDVACGRSKTTVAVTVSDGVAAVGGATVALDYERNREQRIATTGADGTATFYGEPSGREGTATVVSPIGVGSAALPGWVAGANLFAVNVVALPVDVYVTVLDALGAPVPTAAVDIFVDGIPVASGTTDGTGLAMFLDLPAGNAVITASDGGASAAVDATLVPGINDVMIQLAP